MNNKQTSAFVILSQTPKIERGKQVVIDGQVWCGDTILDLLHERRTDKSVS